MCNTDFTMPHDSIEELAPTVGLTQLQFAELFGADWSQSSGPMSHDFDSDPSGGYDAEVTPWHISGEPPLLMIRVFHHGVFLAVPHGSWSSVSRLEYQPSHQVYLPRADFATGRAEAVVYTQRLRRKRAIRYCTFCHRPTPPELRFGDDVCMGCASRWYAVIH
ncbi:hypothetical protein [Nocardioides sp. Root151]|uniref:hypothetical protein n=1 Tax=Nocardioides sp. Root151 TaxID=1736475 RepID=UPI0007028977|nr:hypothetical protein [Nocardioides sp. Root151]KQZ67134.1 hypothetical protein ASD66_19275 [Nocardioides sp. Root151]